MDPEKKYQYLQDLTEGLSVPCILYTASLGSNLGNNGFLGKILHGITLELATTQNVHIIDNMKRVLLTFYSRALRRGFINRIGLVSSGAKSHVFQ